jgi:protein required for attachment to host cells
MKENAWVVVANGSVARIFAGKNSHASSDQEILEHPATRVHGVKVANGKPTLSEIEVLEHPATRVHGRDLTTGKPGRAFDSFGGARHGLEPKLTPQENEAEHFAAHLAQHLEHGRRANAFTKLYLIVSPSFLGMLRLALHPHIRELVAFELDKDATAKSLDEIRTYLPIRL